MIRCRRARKAARHASDQLRAGRAGGRGRSERPSNRAMWPAPPWMSSPWNRPAPISFSGWSRWWRPPIWARQQWRRRRKVALQVAEQMADFLLTGTGDQRTHIAVERGGAPNLRPYMALAHQLGSFAGQLTRFQSARGQDRVRRQAAELEHAPPHRHGACRLLRPVLDMSTWSMHR